MSFGGFGSGGGFGSNNNNTTSGGFGGFGSNNNNTNTTSTFGSSNTGFGANNNNSAGGLFGSGGNTGGFGSSNTGGGFGSTNNNAFGASKPAFGASTSTGGGGLFGGSSTTATAGGFGGFGSNNNTTTNNTTSSFGGGGTSLFGGSNNAAKPAFGTATTGTTGGGLFGGSSNNTTNNTSTSFGSGFGTNTPASTALGSGPLGDPPGTANVTNFQPFVEKENATSSAQNSFQCILFQDPYKKWSAEELRLADYAQGRRFGGASGGGAFGVGSTFGGGFGTNNQQSTNTFGAASNTNTNSGGGLFGSNATSNTGGAFGQTNNTTTNSFGSGGGGLFGSNTTANKPAGGGLFGSSTTTPQNNTGGGLFGSNTNNNTNTSFGSNNNTGSAFGSTTNNTTGGGLFGNNNNQAQQNKPSGFSFGNTANTSNTTGGAFGSNTGSAFGNNTTNTNTGGGLFGNNNNNTGGTGGGLFGGGNNTQQQQQNTGSAFGGGFGTQNNQQQSGGSLFGGGAQQKPAGGGLFGNTNTAGNTGGGGLFGGGNNTNNTASPFGQNNTTNNQTGGGGLFGGNKPATGGGLFGNSNTTQNNNTGGGLFGGGSAFGQNNTNTQQQSGGLFGGGLNNQATQNKPSLFGSTNQTTGGFGGQNTGSQPSLATSQQQTNNGLGGSMFGNSQVGQQTQPSLTASVNDPSAYGASLFGNLSSNEVVNPGPLATPSSKRQSKRPSILPMYKLNPASASRFVTPQKRVAGYGFSYSTYGTPNSPSSVASTPGNMSNSLLGGGSLTRSLSKSISTNSLRRNFNVEDSLLAPNAFSASPGSRFNGNNSVKKLVINRDLRPDLFTPPKEKQVPAITNGSSKLTKRVSFDTSADETIENDASNVPSAEDLGYIRPRPTNGANGSQDSSTPEAEQVKGNELAIVHEEGSHSPAVKSPSASNGQPGDYWMSPSQEEILSMNRVQRQKVSNYTVGRQNIGYVQFKVPVDLTTVDLDNLYDQIVILEPRTATVYPNPAKKPPMGKGLNVPALITLENAYPRSSRGKQTTVKKHIERLKRIEGTTFENYDETTGQWQFSVPHFTTYGLDDSEDEDDEPVAASNARRSPSPAVSEQASDLMEPLRERQSLNRLPGAFDHAEAYDSDEAEMTQQQPSFLASRSVGSTSNALVPVSQDDLDEEYAMSEDEVASTSSGHHHATEQEDDSFDFSQPEPVQETPGGIMRARMRAIKGSATPMKVQVAAGDDWMDMLNKTISPRKRDRALLKSTNQTEKLGRNTSEHAADRFSPKKRVVSDGRGFATSIDLMNSLFDKAKAPAEDLQASMRPRGVKWPYKRITKNLDESNMDPKDRAWHNTMRPTWGPSGTLVFAATPNPSAFMRTRRITERNGLMTVMKGEIVSETQDIRIAKFTNEMSARAIDTHTKLTRVELIDNVPTVKMSPTTCIRDFSAGGSSKNQAVEHERLVWELASVLFDKLQVPVDMQTHPDALDKLRRENLSRFWAQMVESRTDKAIAMAGSNEEKALASLSGHRIAQACKFLLEGKNFRLATLISLIGTGTRVQKDIREQLKDWQDASVLSEFSQPIRALYEMLSGNVCACEGVKGNVENRMDSFVISKRFGLNWQQAFGLRLWYASSSDVGITDAIDKYLEDVRQDKELPPATWFAENGIDEIWDDPEQDRREDLLWGLLRLYSSKETDLEEVLRPENSQLSPLDFRVCWQLNQALTSIGQVSYTNNAREKADAATISFAAQLTHEGSWMEAAFVLLHLTDPTARSMAIQDHICRHAGQIGAEDSNSFKKLTRDLKIPSSWIFHAKALYMRSVKKDPAEEVKCLLQAESFADAHRTFIKQVAPSAIIERDYDSLADLLMKFEGHHARVPDWNVGGEIYKAFLQLMGYRRRHEQPPPDLVNSLLESLPAMHGNTPEAGITEYAALTDMAAEVAKSVATMAKAGQMDTERILHLPLTEDVLLRHSTDLAWSHYTSVMAGH